MNPREEALKEIKTWLYLLLPFTFYFSLFALSGCGYTLYRKTSLPFDSIQIGNIENKTFEPKLDDMLQEVLVEEFSKNGVSIHQDADYKISGIIHMFDLKVLSEKKGVAVEYEVSIKGDFRLFTPSGAVRDFKNVGSPFIVSLPVSGPLEDAIVAKELASEKAIREMVMEIVDILIYSLRR